MRDTAVEKALEYCEQHGIGAYIPNLDSTNQIAQDLNTTMKPTAMSVKNKEDKEAT